MIVSGKASIVINALELGLMKRISISSIAPTSSIDLGFMIVKALVFAFIRWSFSIFTLDIMPSMGDVMVAPFRLSSAVFNFS